MILIIPIAGKGLRFKNNYDIPKPFLKLNNNIPMYREAINTFTRNPNFINNVIIITLEDYKQYYSDYQYKNEYIHYLSKYTQGQAETCYYANDIIQKLETPIIISACDNSALYNFKLFEKLIKDTDIIIWTFETDSLETSKTDSLIKTDSLETIKTDSLIKTDSTYSWAEIQNDNIIKVHTKKYPISSLKESELKPIVGTFYFKSMDLYNKGYLHIINNNIKVNNEYYIENMFNYLIENGYKIKNFTIDKYIGWGIPTDYEKNK